MRNPVEFFFSLGYYYARSSTMAKIRFRRVLRHVTHAQQHTTIIARVIYARTPESCARGQQPSTRKFSFKRDDEKVNRRKIPNRFRFVFFFFVLPLHLSGKHVIVKTITYNALSLSLYFFLFRPLDDLGERKLRFRARIKRVGECC